MLEYLKLGKKQQNTGELKGWKEKDNSEIIIEEECEQ